MKKQTSWLLWVFVVCITMNGYAQNTKMQVIFDTDIGNDVDDILALSMLYHDHKKGLIDLKAITISKGNPAAVGYTDMLNRYYGLPEIPLAYVGNDGKTPEAGPYLNQTLRFEIDGKYPFKADTNLYKQVPEAYKLQRKLLSEAADHSISFIVVGFSTNIAKLLHSVPDEFSDLSGKELVSRKVAKMYMMGGRFSDQPYSEYNIVKDISAAQTVFNEWPTPIEVSGWEVGSELKFPAKALLEHFPPYWEHPLVNSYFHYIKMPYDRETWDLTAVLQAVRPEKKYFKLSKPGKITIDDKGVSTFQARPSGKHRYFILHAQDKEKIMHALIQDVIGK